MTDTPSSPAFTAGIVVIGDEILSGRTRDTNSGTIAAFLTERGIDLREVRVVPDDQPLIVEAIRTLKGRYDFVLTTGGIGPTHDDITADAVGAAFGRPVIHDPRAVEILRAHYRTPEALTEARLRMARMPEGADLIENPLSRAPGFRVENVFVMAGVPKIMEVMLDDVSRMLPTGIRIESRTIDCPFGEGVIGGPAGGRRRGPSGGHDRQLSRLLRIGLLDQAGGALPRRPGAGCGGGGGQGHALRHRRRRASGGRGAGGRAKLLKFGELGAFSR